MLESRQKKKVRNKWAIALPIVLVLISSILIFNGQVLSMLTDAKRYIIFEGQEWNMLTSKPDGWMTNKKDVSFIVNLTEDYQRVPEGTTIDPDADNPVVVTAHDEGAILGGISVRPQDSNPATVEVDFTGQYKVTVPLNNDGAITVNVEILNNVKWNNSASSSEFQVVRDTLAPEVNFTGAIDGSLYTETVNLNVALTEKHLNTGSLAVSVKKNGGSGEALESPKFVEEGEYNGTYNFDKDGEYEVTVSGQDLAGNSTTKTLSFSLLKNGPELSVLDLDDNGTPLQQLSNTKKIGLKVTSGISIGEATVEIQKGESVVTQTMVPDGRTTEMLEYAISQEGDYELSVIVKDKHANGQTHPPLKFAFTVDHTAPNLTITGVENGSSYREAKIIEVNVEEENPNIAEFTVIRKGLDGKEVPSSVEIKDGKATFKAEEDGEYMVKLAADDRAGNKTEKSVTFKLDTKEPAISISEDVDGKYFKDSKELTITVEDLTLDLLKTILTVKKGLDTYDIGSWILNLFKAEVKHNFTDEGRYEIGLSSTDNVGLSKEMDPVTFTIDKTYPVLVIENITDGEQLKEARDVKVSVTDSNIDWDKTHLKVTRNGFDFFNKVGEEVSKTHKFEEDGIYVMNLESTDKAGNKKTHDPITFTIDKSQPELNISGVENGEHYEKLEGLELSIEDLTFLVKDISLEVTKDGEPYDLGDGKWEESLSKGGLKRAIRKLIFDQDGDYELNLRTKDLLGNESSLGPIKFTIDNTDPIVSISGIDEGAFVQKGKSVNINVKEHNYEHNDVKITVTRQKELEGPKEEYRIGEWKNTGEDANLSHTFNEDGDYELIVEAKDKAGNKAVRQTLEFTVDNEKPKIKITGADQYSYNSISKEIKIKVDERNYSNNNVGITVTRNVEVDGTSVDFPIGVWKNVNKVSDLSYVFNQDGEYQINVNATDAAGNIGETEKLLFTIDKIDPELSITGVDNEHNYRTDKPVNFSIADRNIDLSQTNLKVQRNGKDYNIGELSLTGKTSAVKTFTFSEEGSYVVTLDTKDKAGRGDHDKREFIIDKTNPVVDIDGVDNNSFNSTGKNVMVSVDELNFDTNNVDISATKDGADFNIGKWENSGKLSKLGYNFNQDGLYTILATAKDKAGNGPVSKKMTFTVDKVKPSIEITGVENNAYYNVDKQVNVTIKDVNLDINRITVTRNGARYNAGGFSVNGDLASLSHNFSGEGEYNILVEATDKAGNSFSKTMKFTIDKTKPVITPKFKGQNRVIKNGEYINEVFTPEFALDEAEDMIVSATLNNGGNLGKNIPVAAREMSYTYKVLARDKAGNESTIEISFTLDTTKPMLNISGVLDGFFNKDIAPKVTYSDVHLDQSKTSVTLNGRQFENGTKLEYEQDYILKAVVTDLAKNVSSRTIVFTIDKTSPVIKFKEPISNKYFNTDLLPQLLIEDMSSYDIIAMMLDGKPYEAGDPIKEEGKHVMFFEVKDKAGNIQQLSVEFIIDKTAPKVVYEGVKNKEKYYDPIDIAIRLDNPNDKIKSVMINGEIFDGEVVEENGYKVIKTTLAEIKPYEIAVTAYDDAENEKTTVISFEIVEKGALVKFYENKPLLGGTIAGLVGLLGATATMLVRRRRVRVEE
jgi:large repetitive protein